MESPPFLEFAFHCASDGGTVAPSRNRETETDKERERDAEKERKNAAITSLPVNSLYYSVVFVRHHGADRMGQITKIATPERVCVIRVHSRFVMHYARQLAIRWRERWCWVRERAIFDVFRAMASVRGELLFIACQPLADIQP